jgi:hypothetical protein
MNRDGYHVYRKRMYTMTPVRREEERREELDPPPSYSSLHVEESPPSYAEALTKC